MAVTEFAIMVRSESNPRVMYEIVTDAAGVPYCSCPAWKHQKGHPQGRTCKHLKAVKKALEAK